MVGLMKSGLLHHDRRHHRRHHHHHHHDHQCHQCHSRVSFGICFFSSFAEVSHKLDCPFAGLVSGDQPVTIDMRIMKVYSTWPFGLSF